MTPKRILYDVLSDDEAEIKDMTILTFDTTELAVDRLLCSPRKGLVTEKDGRYFFREGRQGTPIKIGKFTTDGYDYVYEFNGKLYITHSCANVVYYTYKYSLTEEDYKILHSLEKDYLAYLDTL